jgi:hypothetical protein
VEQDRAPSILVHIAKLAGQPLVSYQVIVDLISATTTSTGLEPKGVTVSDAEMAALNIECAEFHGEWNYTIRPTNRSDRAVDS